MSSFLSLFSVPESSTARSSAAVPVSDAGGQARSTRATGADRLDQAFASASQQTGVPFDYFMTTAMRESSLDVNAAATTSSARGPFQFIEQTWLGMVHKHGDALGLGSQAAAIERTSNGHYRMDDSQARAAVLSLRHDPQLSAVMSGLYLQGNAGELQNALGRPVSVGEGYVAHVFGPSGASRLISLAEQQPNRVAADVFPAQAAANRGLFYERSGAPVSVSDLYDRLVEGFPAAIVNAESVNARAPRHAPASRQIMPEDGSPLDLEPAGFDALAQAEPIQPDRLAQLGLFSAAGRGAVPFFAALYSPDGIAAPQLSEELLATHGDADGFHDPSDDPSFFVPSPMPRPDVLSAPAEPDMPLDLVNFVEHGQLVAVYRNPAAERAGSLLVPPV